MNQQSVATRLKELRGVLQAGWGRLLGDDATRLSGQQRVLSARLQRRYGLTESEASACANGRLREPGALDDWNDTRSILDM
jgi:uncharacterized protein YjbJ (UPF0337 family)